MNLPAQTPAFPWTDFSRSGWVTLLPELTGLDVLNIGAGAADKDAVPSLSACRTRTLTCVGHPPAQTRELPVRWVGSLEDLPTGQFDVAILNDPSIFDSSANGRGVHSLLHSLSSRLRPGGWLLVCLPDGIRNIAWRWKIKTILAAASFEDVSLFASAPTASYPLQISPIDSTATVRRALACQAPEGDANPLTQLRTGIKHALADTLGSANPWFGIIVVARRGDAASTIKSAPIYQQIVRTFESSCPSPTRRNLSVLIQGRPYSSRQHVFILDLESAMLLSVAKLQFGEVHTAAGRSGFAPSLSVELESLGAAQKLSPALARIPIHVPAPIALHFAGNSSGILTTAVRGTRVDHLVHKANSRQDRAQTLACLCDLAALQIRLQQELSKAPSGSFPALDRRLFSSEWLDSPWSPRETPATRRSLHWVQHGDFATVNLYFDEKSAAWSLIDWEWTAGGYPPLFDLFNLIRSFNHSTAAHPPVDLVEGFFAPIWSSLFESNWFSDGVRDVLLRTARELQIPEEEVFECLLQYVLVMYNRHDPASVPPEIRASFACYFRNILDRKDEFVLFRKSAGKPASAGALAAAGSST